MVSSVNNHPQSVISSAYEKLRLDIESGRFAAGEKLPGERELSQLYSIGRSSMRQVLLQLQDERYIERIPVYGTFVRKDVDRHFQTISLAFVSPDRSFGPETIGISGWGSITEMLRGIYEESSVHPGLRVSILHCEDTRDTEVLHRQLEELNRFDGAIFCGYLMASLKELYSHEGKPAVVVAPKLNAVPERFPAIVHDFTQGVQDLLAIIARKATESELVLLYHSPHSVDSADQLQLLKTLRLELAARNIGHESLEIDYVQQSSEEFLPEFSRQLGDLQRFDGKLLWVLNRALLRPLSYLLTRNNIHAEIIGFSASMAMLDFFPPVYYLLEPFYETGRSAVRMLLSQLEGNPPLQNVLLQPELYYGMKKFHFSEK